MQQVPSVSTDFQSAFRSVKIMNLAGSGSLDAGFFIFFFHIFFFILKTSSLLEAEMLQCLLLKLLQLTFCCAARKGVDLRYKVYKV